MPEGFARPLAALRTDLDTFSSDEASLLRYHGYWSAHARLGSIRPDLAGTRAPGWRDYADLSKPDEERLVALLAEGTRRRVWR